MNSNRGFLAWDWLREAVWVIRARAPDRIPLHSAGSFAAWRRPAASATQGGCLLRRPCQTTNRSASVRRGHSASASCGVRIGLGGEFREFAEFRGLVFRPERPAAFCRGRKPRDRGAPFRPAPEGRQSVRGPIVRDSQLFFRPFGAWTAPGFISGGSRPRQNAFAP